MTAHADHPIRTHLHLLHTEILLLTEALLTATVALPVRLPTETAQYHVLPAASAAAAACPAHPVASAAVAAAYPALQAAVAAVSTEGKYVFYGS